MPLMVLAQAAVASQTQECEEATKKLGNLKTLRLELQHQVSKMYT
jgi:hypothetical protein